MRWGRRATMPRFPNKIKDLPPPPDFDLYVGARGVFDGAAADLAARSANGDLDFQQWLAVRRLQIYENAEGAFAGVLAQSAARLSFVKRARVDLQTSLGGRKGAGGVDVAGALRETDSDIVGWQLRGYAAEHGTKGLNTGLFYRRVVGGALAGVNVFADYEDGDDGDFWRWSVGGDVKNRLGELSANHYFAITDAQVVGGQNTYTREGYDVDVAVRIPRLEWAKARVGYYNFKGEFGDEDENGFRAGLDLSPGDGLVLGVEYDDDDGKFGGNISYTHHFGEAGQSAQRAGDFNPRAHFYDSARREYSQRITRASGGGGIAIAGNIGFGVFGDGVDGTVTTAGSFAFPVTGAAMVTTETTGNGNATLRQGWELIVGNDARIVFSRGDAATIIVSRGRGAFNRNNANITLMQIGNAVITLLGTRFDFDSSNGNITLHEGGLGIPVSGVNVEVADMMASVVSGGDIVGCGEGQTVMAAGATAKCNIANATSESVMTAVTEGAGEVLIGRITLAGADVDISASVAPSAEFSAVKNGAVINVSLLAAAAMSAGHNVKVARVTVRGSSLQTAKEFLFTVRVNPQAINLIFVGDINNAPLTMAGDIIIGTLEVTNGFGASNINFAAGSGAGFRLDNIDNAANRRALVLPGPNTAVRALSVTLTGDDDNAPQTNAKMLSVTVNVVDRVGLRGGGRYSVYAVNAESAPVAVFEPFGGTPPFNMQVGVAPTNVPAGFSRQNNISATITRTTDNAVGGMEHEFIQEITETRTNGDTARATATVTVIAPISLAVNYKTGGGVLDIGVRQTVATIGAASGGLGGYQFTRETPSGVSYVDGTIVVAQFDNQITTTFNVVVDDRENGNPAPITPPYTLDIELTTIPPLTATPIVVTITTGSSPASGDNNTPIFTVMAQGGTPPYQYGIYNEGTEDFTQPTRFWPPRAVLQYRPVNIIYRFNSPAANEPGIEEQGGLADRFAIRDSATPPRLYVLPQATVHYVLPPPVTLSVNQTVNSTPAGASSVAVATLTYGGGSTGGALTATVVGVKDGFGSVSDNEVLMSASAAGEVIATINAYDANNSTAPNATAQITITFTGGG